MVSAAMKVAPALAAGNCVVLKPAELAPLGPLRFAELCLEAGIPARRAQRRARRSPRPAPRSWRPPRRQDQLHRRRRHRAPDHRAAAAATSRRSCSSSAASRPTSCSPTPTSMSPPPPRCRPALADISGQGCVLPTRLLVDDAVYDEVARRRWRAMASALTRRPTVRRRRPDGSGDRRRQLRPDPRRDRRRDVERRRRRC